MRTTIGSKRLWTTVVAAAVTATIAGCGSTSGSGKASTPGIALTSSIASLAGSQHVSMKLSLTGAVGTLATLDPSGSDDTAAVAALTSGYVGLALNTNGSSKVTGMDLVVHTDGSDLAEIRYVSGSVYAHLDPAVVSKVSGKPFPTSSFSDAASSLNLPIIASLGQGKWVGVTNLHGTYKALTAEAKSLMSSAPASASALPTSPADVAKIRQQLVDALHSATTVTDLPGSTPTSTNRKLSVTVSPKQLLTSLQSALSTLDSLEPALSKVSSAEDSLGSKTYQLEVDTTNGTLSRLDLPINQFMSAADQAKLDGKSVDLVLAVDQSAGSISAPAGAVTVDGTTLVTSLKQMLAESSDSSGSGADSSGSDGSPFSG